MADKFVVDGEYLLEYKHDTASNVMHRRMTQITEDIILARNYEMRKNPGILNDLSFGRKMASIPLGLWEAAKRKYPELNAPDNETRQKALLKFLKTEEGKKCLVQG
jgi:hypothetical protein